MLPVGGRPGTITCGPGMEHETWVRNVLCMPLAEKRLDLTNDEMIEIISRLCTAAGEVHEHFFWIKLLETNLDPRISDLIGDDDNSREMCCSTPACRLMNGRAEAL